MSKLVVYGGAQNPNVWKSLIAAKYPYIYAGVTVTVFPEFLMGVTNKTEDYLRKNPWGKIPTMDTPEGPLFESNTIARYVARSGSNKTLYGSTIYETSVIDQWLDIVRSTEPYIGQWVYPLAGYGVYDAAAVERAKTETMRYFGIINDMLKGKKFATGDNVTLADISLFCCLKFAVGLVLAEELRNQIPDLVAWFNRCKEEANFKSVTGEIIFATYEVKEPKK